ncbi:hypothetical protein GDO86_016770 [Hymenochirus boettgeri]|uniref:Tubulin polyglutamylase TTLL4 n=2 Tax=Hymenochirus boettgeri TaxID=247094 RepID=A0A8T2IKB4_9PIPI|nr:hypothetical protein GDO86_016770 [Hymenochirus boettgeri]
MASVGTEQHHTGSRCDKERISTPVKFLRQNIGTNRVPPTQHSPVWKLERKYLTVTPGNKPHNHVVPHSFSLNSNNRVTTPAPTPPLAPRSGSTLYRFRSFHDLSVRTFDCQKPVTGHKPLDPKPKAADLRPYTSSFRDPAIKPVFKFSYRESAMATSMVDQPPLPSAPVEPKEIPVRSPSKIATKILSENSTLITNSFLRPSSAKVHFYPRVENKLVKSTPSHSSYHGHSVELVQSIGDEARLVCQTCTTAGTLSTNIQGVTAKWNPRTAWKLPEEENLDDSVQYQGAQLAEFVKKLTDKGDLLSTPSLPQLKAIPKHTFHKDSLYSVCKEKVPSALNPFGHQVNSSFPSLSSEMCLNERVDCTVPSVQQTETNLKAASPCASYQSTSCPLLDTNVPNGDCLPEVGKKVQGVNITVMATQISTIHLNKTSSAQETQVQPELLNDMASPLPNDQPDGAEEELPDDLDDSEVEEENEESTADQTTVLSAATSSSSIARQCDGTVEDTSPCSVNVKPALVPSLFPNLPPTIYFGTTDEKVESLPWAQRKLLKWKMSTVTPNIVKQTIARSHFRVTKKNHDWLGCWGHHMKSLAFKSIKEHQKLNHFPGSFQIGRKDRLWRNLSKMQLRFGKKEFNFFPQSFVLPQDIKILKKAWEEGGNRQKWIVKPPASARGMGIQVIHRWSQLPKKRPLLVQRYLHKPYLISGSKFDLRIYVYVTSFDPLRIYMFTDGLVRFASCK